MKAKKIIIPAQSIDEGSLRQWVEETRKISGADITVVTAFHIESDNPAILTALKSVFIPRKERPEITEPAPLQTATLFLRPAPSKHVIRAWRIMDGNGTTVSERVSTDERNTRLSKGQFSEGGIIHHPQEGKYRVTGKAGEAQALELVQ